ncbi:MAG: methyl-accepting chemotaxis protein [Gammaproteobacteria bacterium]|nr:methyl-accepting chemotaxis protein [Gammaproteobacteria bacterium]
MKNLSLVKKFVLLISALVILSISQGALIFTKNSEIIEQASHLGQTEVPLLNRAHQLKLSVTQVQQWLTDISATRGRDGLNDGFDEAENNAKLFKSLIRELEQLDPANTDTYEAMIPSFNAYYETGKKMARAYIEEGPDGGNQMMAEFDQVAATMSTQVDGFLDNTLQRLSIALNKQEQASITSRQYFITSILIIFVGLGILFAFTKQALSRLPGAINKITQITNGDLTSSIHSNKKDEIGQLLDAVETMRQQLVSIITQIHQTSSQLTATSATLTQATAKSNDYSSRQQSETQQVAASMNEMTATIQEVVRNINITAGTASDTDTESESGRQIVNQSIQDIRQLSDQLENAAMTIQQLENDSETITTVLDVIRGIAEQTNLLALNAAIEAARAGEQGRGFAVVADEVRALASRTQESTAEINQMLEKVLNGSRKAVEVTTICQQQAQSVVEQTAGVDKSLTSIASSVREISDMSNQIATATEEQAAVSEEINNNINHIEEMSQHTVESMNELTHTGQELTQLANQLDDMIQHFKV